MTSALATVPYRANEQSLTEGEPELGRIAPETVLKSLERLKTRATLARAKPNSNGIGSTSTEISGRSNSSYAEISEPQSALPPPVVVQSQAVTLLSMFPALQEWEGYVLAVHDDHFIADLVDLTAGHSHVGQQASIPLEELSEDDMSKLAAGRIFRWAIGYQRNRAGTKARVSQIIFRDLPSWRAADRRMAETQAESLAGSFGQANALKRPDRSSP
jgi:hypothetical protein